MSPCDRCRLDPGLCLCAEIPRVASRTRFLVLRHLNESVKRTNSARLASLALPHCEIRDTCERRERGPFEPPEGAWLLYPGGSAVIPEGRPAAVVVLDGSWRETKRMFLRNPALHRLPRLSLAAPTGTPRLRKPPPGGMATLEAIAHAVEALEGPDVARPIHELFALFVSRSVTGARRAGRRLLR